MVKYPEKKWGGLARVSEKKQRIGMRKQIIGRGGRRGGVHILNSINHRPGVRPRPLPHTFVVSIVFTNKLLQGRNFPSQQNKPRLLLFFHGNKAPARSEKKKGAEMFRRTISPHLSPAGTPTRTTSRTAACASMPKFWG